MTIGDKIINAATGSNMKTIRVNCPQMAEIIYECFGDGEKGVEHIFKMLKGKFFAWTEEDSPDGKYHLHISHFRRSLTIHRVVWVKCYKTEEIFEWRGYTLGPLKREFSCKVETECRSGSMEDIYELIEKQRKKRRAYILGVIAALVLIIGVPGGILYSNNVRQRETEERMAAATKMTVAADQQMAVGNYNTAYELYEKAGKYADMESVMNCLYMMVKEYCDKGDLDSFYDAEILCEKMSGEKREEARNLIQEKKYNSALIYYNEGLYKDAERFLDGISGDYKEKNIYLEKISSMEEAIGDLYGTYFKKDSNMSLVESEKELDKTLTIGVFTIISYKKREDGIELELRDYSTGKKEQAVYYNDYNETVLGESVIKPFPCVKLGNYNRKGKNYGGYYLRDKKLAEVLR